MAGPMTFYATRAGDFDMTNYLAGGAEFLYPHAGDTPAPKNVKLLLLTRGGICTTGLWHRDWCLGWLPLPKRNMKKEDMEEIEVTNQDRMEFIAYLKTCTLGRLYEVLNEEYVAHRRSYALLAREEINMREEGNRLDIIRQEEP